MTPFAKKKDLKNNWYLVNAENLVVGRLAAYISKVLRGKNKAKYDPQQDNGDFVIVTNIEKIKFTGKKFKNKKYYKHTGHPGGIKETHPFNLKEKNKSQDILKFAVKRMLPGGPLAKKQLSKLKMYYGDKHPHLTQNPVEIKFSTLNKKNSVKVL
tara:strand:- start:1211 stop:1675 length:465 start_codon:yes stop_codon:yes gene_type:complete